MGRIDNHDGKAWRARAEECRAIADTFDNPETRAKMYAVAAEYDRMAEDVEQRNAAAADSEQRDAPAATSAGPAPDPRS